MSKCAQSTNMLSFLLKYSLGHCTHLTKGLLLKAESPSRMFAPGWGGRRQLMLDKSWKFSSGQRSWYWHFLVYGRFILTYMLWEKQKEASETCDLYEEGSWARPRRCKSKLRTSAINAIKQITGQVLLLRKMRIGCGLGKHDLIITQANVSSN